MVRIDVKGFAGKIAEYLTDARKPHVWFFHNYCPRNDRPVLSVEETLNLPYTVKYEHEGRKGSFTEYRGIRFGYTTHVVMKIFRLGYKGLTDSTTIKEFSERAASAMQDFARPFPNGDNLCYPHFLMHGIAGQFTTLDEMIDKFHQNARIIHETESMRDKFINTHNKNKRIFPGLRKGFDHGQTDDYFGICSYLANSRDKNATGSDGYLAKVSFFLDITNREATILTIQGQRFRPLDGSADVESRKKSRNYARWTAKLELDPRAFLLRNIAQTLIDDGYRNVRVIKAEHHPCVIEKHKGFRPTYTATILGAGITIDNGVYLERRK